MCALTKTKGDPEVKYGRPALPLSAAFQLQPSILLDFSCTRLAF
jgi:hypothetical protein